MLPVVVLALLGAVSASAAAESSTAAVAHTILTAGLDPDACYRVRDLDITKDELKFYLTEGYLIFTRPVNGRRLGAVFSNEAPGGDAEVLVMPPHRSERVALARFAKTPNLNEHLKAAVFLFTDGTGEKMLAQIEERAMKKVPEMGTLLAPKWDSVIRNLATSFEIRLVQDVFSPAPEQSGFMYAAVTGSTLGNFDLIYDHRAREQITIGQVAARENRLYFDVWTSFQARSIRNGQKKAWMEDHSVSDIRIEAQLGTDLHMNAVTRLKLTPNRSTGRAAAFELSRRMKITSVRINGEPAEAFTHDSMRANLMRAENDLFLVIAPQPLEPGRTYEFEFEHEGDVVSAAGNGVYFVGARGTWYPHRGIDFAHYDLRFRYPKGLSLVSTGEVVEHTADDTWQVTRRRTSSPVRIAGFNLGDYDKATTTKGPYTVEVYANRKVESALQTAGREMIIIPPPVWPRGAQRRPGEVVTIGVQPMPQNPTSRLQELATEVSGAMDFMTTSFGPPPLKTLTVSPIPGVFGQGFPGLLYLSTVSYLNPKERPVGFRTPYQQTFFSEILQAHETAHQWWGNLVTTANYRDEWIMEALANYSALMFLEKRKGRRALDAVLEEYRTHLVEKTESRTLESAGPIVWGVRLNSSQTPGAWRAITYEKGSWIIHMMRARMGDDRFFKMLSELVKRFERRAVTTADFQALAAEFLPPKSADPKMEAFFEQWVYGTGVPSLKLNYTVQGKAPAVRIRGNVSQTEVDEDFSALVPVEVTLPGKRTVTHWVRTGGEPGSFTIELKQAPVKVQLDPANVMLAMKK